MKKILIAAFILIIAGASLFSQNLESLGYSILSTRTEDGFTVVTAQDPSTGLTFDLYYKSFTQEQLYFLQEARNIILSWKYLIPKDLQIVFQPEQVEIRVIPASFTYNGINYAKYIPSAIAFYYDNNLEYDFRILVDNITLRVQGPYFNEEQLASKLQSAVENPMAYIQTHDPEHIVRRLGEISSDIEGLKAGQTDSNKAIAALNTEIAALRDQNTTLNEQLETLLQKIEELTAANEDIAGKYRLLQLGTIAVTTQGLFSIIKDFNKDIIEKAIAIKEQNPSYTEKELLAACKDQGIKISAKEIHIIFMVYFNEF